MSSKAQLQKNNEELQSVLQTIQSLPTKNTWGGGTLIVPGPENIEIPAYTDKTLTISGDENLIAENIKKGVEIFNVTGTLEEGKKGIDFGVVNFAEKTNTFTVKHGIGDVPTKFFVCAGSMPNSVAQPVICNETQYLYGGCSRF